MITFKNAREIEEMAIGGRLLGRILREIALLVSPGVQTRQLDEIAQERIRSAGCIPAFLGYTPGAASKPYPATLCTSVNDTVVHGLPSSYVIQAGDVVKLDIGLIYKGWYLDCATTVLVEPVHEALLKLKQVTEQALYAGIAQANVGHTIGDIGAAVSAVVAEGGFSVVQALTGHGIGRELHEDPYVFNIGHPGRGEELKEGMVIAIEPMVAMGSGKVKKKADDSYVTADHSLSAHFEHTIAITAAGPRILTKP